MELRHLKTFTVVADVLGFTRAAELLGYAQSSVTTQIRSLEEELEAPLFDRLGKTVVLTEAGRKLLPYANEMLRLQAAMKELVNSDSVPSGTLTIGAPESIAAYRLPQIIQEYKRLFPQVTLVLKPGASWDLRNQVRNGQADIALLLEPEIHAPDLMVETLIEETIVLVAPLNHPLAYKTPLNPMDLQHETFLHTEPGCSYRELFDRYLREHGVVSPVTMEFWNLETIKNCVRCGLGISVLPLVTVQSELEDRKIAALEWNNGAVQVATQLIYHKGKWISPPLAAFLRVVHKHATVWRNGAECAGTIRTEI